jgi:hypothetical protein
MYAENLANNPEKLINTHTHQKVMKENAMLQKQTIPPPIYKLLTQL